MIARIRFKSEAGNHVDVQSFLTFFLSTEGFPLSCCGLCYPVIGNTYFFITCVSCLPQDASLGLSFILPYFLACVILILSVAFTLTSFSFSAVHNSESPMVFRGADPQSLVTCLTVAANPPLFDIKTKQNLIYLTSFFSSISHFPRPGEFVFMQSWELWAPCCFLKQGKIILKECWSQSEVLRFCPPFPVSCTAIKATSLDISRWQHLPHSA